MQHKLAIADDPGIGASCYTETMADNSFDIVSKVDLQEVSNAIQQALKEVHTRYDLKDSKSSIELYGK